MPTAPLATAVVAAARLPESLDADRLQWLAVGGIAVVVVVGLLVVRAVARFVTRLAALVVSGALAVSLGAYRGELDECRARCDCQLAGREVPVPGCPDDDVVVEPAPTPATTTGSPAS